MLQNGHSQTSETNKKINPESLRALLITGDYVSCYYIAVNLNVAELHIASAIHSGYSRKAEISHIAHVPCSTAVSSGWVLLVPYITAMYNLI